MIREYLINVFLCSILMHASLISSTLQTTLARIIAKVAHQKLSTKFVQLSATTAGVKDVKEIVKVARNEKIMFKRNTILFIDEVHRFNKLQQVR